MAYTKRMNRKPVLALAIVSVTLLSGCAVTPMDLLPPSARSLIEADMRTNVRAHSPSGKLSVQEMLSRVQPSEPAQSSAPAKPAAPAPSETIEITLGAEGVGLARDDFESFSMLLSSLEQTGKYKTTMSVGSAGGADARAVVFKTFSDTSKLRSASIHNGHAVKASIDPKIAAGLVEIKIDRIMGKTDA